MTMKTSEILAKTMVTADVVECPGLIARALIPVIAKAEEFEQNDDTDALDTLRYELMQAGLYVAFSLYAQEGEHFTDEFNDFLAMLKDQPQFGEFIHWFKATHE